MSKPNYRKQAMGLAALGRGPDNALVHMSRGEVASLQKIANTAGGSLSINPKTGLPEAGFLNSILPMIAGGLSMLIPGMQPFGAALIGAGTGALTGDKDQSLLMRAGLGALGGWGGAGVAQGLAGVGASAGKEAASAATQEALKNTTGEVTKQLGADALKTNATQALSQGVQALGTEGGRQAFMGATGKFGLAAAGAPTIAETFKQPTLEAEKTADPMYYTGVTFDPYTGEYSGGEYTSEYPGMAEGGEVPPPDPMAQTRAYYQGLLTPQGGTPPSSQALIDYMNKLNTDVVQTPVPARPTPPPAAATSTVATPATATQPMSYGKKVKKKTVQVPLPGYSYDQATGTYTQTSGPTGGVTNPYASTDFDRILSVNSPYLLGIQDEIRGKLASQGATGYAAGGSVMPQMPGGMPQQQSLGNLQSAFSNGIAQQGALRQSPMMPGGMPQQRPSTMPQMFGSMFQQQLPGGMASQSTPRQSDQMPGGMFQPMTPQMPGGMPQQRPSTMPQMFGSMFQQQLPGGMASQSTPRQSDQMPGGMFQPMTPQMPGGMLQQQPSMMPQMFGSMFQQQLPGGMASQSTPRQSDQMPGGMFQPMTPQMSGFQQRPGGIQQPSMMQSVMAPQQLGAGFPAQSVYGSGGSFSAPALRFAAGGPTYAAGGKLLRGPGDGMSDSIPAVIGGTQRAALADGEFVMPADVVAHLGNGSTTAGAGRLYEMMDRVRKARTGSTTQPPAVNMGRLMPA